MRMMWQLLKTALVVRELIAAGMFAEIRITRGARGLESRLFVNHHGIVSIMHPRAALGLCAAMRRAAEDESTERIRENSGRHAVGYAGR